MRARRPGMSVIVATAYMEEAERFDWLAAMNGGKALASGAPARGSRRNGAATLEEAFIALLPETRARRPPRIAHSRRAAARRWRADHRRAQPDLPLRRLHRGRSRQFHHRARRDLRLPRLQRLRQDDDDEDADRPAGRRPRARRCCSASRSKRADMGARYRVGYMSQSFSLYAELTVRQNLDLHAQLFHLPAARAEARIDELDRRVRPRGLSRPAHGRPAARHSPAAFAGGRDRARAGDADPRRADFGRRSAGARPFLGSADRPVAPTQGVTIFVSTHFMNEAARCDRIALMDSGRVLASDTPAELVRSARRRDAGRRVHQLSRGGDRRRAAAPVPVDAPQRCRGGPATLEAATWFSPRRLLAYTIRETLELLRDPIRLGFSLFGTALADAGVRLRRFHRCQQSLLRRARPRPEPGEPRLSRGAARLHLFRREAAARRLRRARKPPAGAATIKAAIEIPPGFGRDIKRGRPACVGGLDRRRDAVPRGDDPRLSRGHARALSRRPRDQDHAAQPRRRPPISRSDSNTIRISTASMRWCHRRWR